MQTMHMWLGYSLHLIGFCSTFQCKCTMFFPACICEIIVCECSTTLYFPSLSWFISFMNQQSEATKCPFSLQNIGLFTTTVVNICALNGRVRQITET